MHATRWAFLAAFLAAFTACAHGPSVTGAGGEPKPLPARPWGDEVLYFVLVDRFADGDPANNIKVKDEQGYFHGGDLKGLTQHLDEIADLGVSAIWINPVLTQVKGYVTGAGFEDWAYHGYWADGYDTVDPRFGTEQDLKDFVNACHARGIRVLLDVVYNHVGYDSTFIYKKETRNLFRSGINGQCGEGDDLTACLAGLPDWKTEEEPVRQFLFAKQLAWASKYGFDGYRLDTVKHVEPDFWVEHSKLVDQQLGKDFFLLGEVFGGNKESLSPYFEDDALDAGFDFEFQGQATAWGMGRMRSVAMAKYLETRHRIPKNRWMAQFLSSHDVTGALKLAGGDVDAFRLAATLQLTAMGIPTIYYGEEVARDIGQWPANRSDMPWGDKAIEPGAGKPRNEALRAYYRQLIGIRRAHTAFSRGTQEKVFADGDVLAFLRRDTNDAVVVCLNRGTQPATLKVPAPKEWGQGTVTELIEGKKVAVTEGSVDLVIPPKSARILGTKAR
ncbi:MAG: alpha-amylase family glycosyl hydrolase [Anaeromyxobacter sp.]